MTRLVIISLSILITVMALSAQTKIACVGTSITAGVPESFNYPQFLSQMLGTRYTVSNNGQSGISLYAYLGCAAAPGIFTGVPDIITIELGTNDARAGFSRAGFTSAYNALIDTFLSIKPVPEIRLVLPIPILANPYELSPDTMSICIVPIIRAIATERHLLIIDCNTPMIGHSELYEGDGTHPLRFEPAGYDTLAHIFYRALTGAPTVIANSSMKNAVSNMSIRERLQLALYGHAGLVYKCGNKLFDAGGRVMAFGRNSAGLLRNQEKPLYR